MLFTLYTKQSVPMKIKIEGVKSLSHLPERNIIALKIKIKNQ